MPTLRGCFTILSRLPRRRQMRDYEDLLRDAGKAAKKKE